MQFLRPISNITQTSFTGGFAEIDEASASDVDFAYGAHNTIAVLEVGLTDPGGVPREGTTTTRYRIAKVDRNGIVTGSGNTVTVTCGIYDGATLIEADSARTADGTWTGYEFTPDMGGVSDWSDLRLRFTTSASGGSGTSQTGVAVSWAEAESPDNANVAPVGVAIETDSALALAGKLLGDVGLATETDEAIAPATEVVAGLSVETDEALALTFKFMFAKDGEPDDSGFVKDELAQGIFDPAIFDPAIFDTGSSVAVTKDAKPPSVVLE